MTRQRYVCREILRTNYIAFSLSKCGQSLCFNCNHTLLVNRYENFKFTTLMNIDQHSTAKCHLITTTNLDQFYSDVTPLFARVVVATFLTRPRGSCHALIHNVLQRFRVIGPVVRQLETAVMQ